MTYQDLTGERRREPRFEAVEQQVGPPPGPPGGRRARSRWRGKLLGALVALSALAGFAGIAWYATNQGKKNSATVVPMIQADNTPVKVLPEKPGGMKVPNQDKLIYLQISPDGKKVKKEKVLPGAEKPMPKPKPPEAAKAAKAPEAGKPKSVTQAPLQPPKMEAPAKPEAAAGQGAAKAGEGKKPSKDQALDREALQAKVAAAAKESEKAAEGAKAKAKAESGAATAAGKAASDQLAKRAPAGAGQPAKSTGSAFQVQLGSSKLEDRAKAEARRLSRAYASLLGDTKISAVRADLGKRGVFFRLWAGPFPDRASAEAMCAKLKARKQGCLVIQR